MFCRSTHIMYSKSFWLSHVERWKEEWLTLGMLGPKICHVLVLWFDLDGWMILSSGLLISAFYNGPADSIHPPCSTQNWDPEEFVKDWRLVAPRSVSIQRERQYELVRVWLAGFSSPESDIRLLGRSADTLLPRLFHPAHSYTDLITQLQLTFFLGARYIASPAKTANQYLRVSSIAVGRNPETDGGKHSSPRKENNIWRVWTAAMCLLRRWEAGLEVSESRLWLGCVYLENAKPIREEHDI